MTILRVYERLRDSIKKMVTRHFLVSMAILCVYARLRVDIRKMVTWHCLTAICKLAQCIMLDSPAVCYNALGRYCDVCQYSFLVQFRVYFNHSVPSWPLQFPLCL